MNDETEVELLEESSNEYESKTVEEEADQSNREIEFNLQIHREWEILAKSQFEEKKLQLNCELTGPLHSCNSPMSFFSLFFNKELLEQIVLQTNMYNTTSGNVKGIKPVPPVEIDGLKKVLGVILYMGIESFQTGNDIGNFLHCLNSFQMQTYLLIDLNKFYRYCILMAIIYRNLLGIQITIHSLR